MFVLITVALLVAGRGLWKSTNYQIAKDKFQSMLIAAPAEVDARLELLEPFGRDTINRLIDDGADESNERQSLHRLLAQSRFGSAAEIPLSSLLASVESAEPGECANIVAALRPLTNTVDQPELFRSIRNRYEASVSDESRYRLAVIALHLGDVSMASEMLQFRPDPDRREQFIEWYPQWHGRLAQAIEVLDQSKDPALQTALLKCLGQIPRHEFSDETFQSLQTATGSLYRSGSFPGVHSCAHWLASQLEIPLDQGPLRAPNNSWFIQPEGEAQITFLRVEKQIVPIAAGLTEGDRKFFRLDRMDVRLQQPFYMSAREVSGSLFFEFLNSLPPDNPSRTYFENQKIASLLDQDLPIANVTWNEAVEFCNWLSTQHGRTPRFSWNESESIWEPIENANGYRLATNLEWEAANRMRTKTTYFFGNDTARMTRYAIVGSHQFPDADYRVGLRGQKMPNDNGFFDMMGNASEWCEDFRHQSSTQRRTTRGGYAMASLRYLASSSGFEQEIDDRFLEPGIRLVLDAE